MAANEKALAEGTGESAANLIGERVRTGLSLLWRSYICADATGTNIWDFALRTGKLYEAGMTSSDLHWLVASGFAEHGQEMPASADRHRSFNPGNDHFFNELTCLILTARGAELAEHVFREATRRPLAMAAAAGETLSFANAAFVEHETNMPVVAAVKPCWNADRRELSLAGLLVKRFRVPARNQETILSVFEEEGWAEHIHDPLPKTADIDAPTRLHDAINRLNRCQINPLLRFHGDGRGTGILWALSSDSLLR